MKIIKEFIVILCFVYLIQALEKGVEYLELTPATAFYFGIFVAGAYFFLHELFKIGLLIYRNAKEEQGE